MFSCFKEVSQIASSPAVQFLTSYMFERFRYVHNILFRYSQVCYLYVFTTHYDKSSLKMYLDEYIQMFDIYYFYYKSILQDI